MGFKDNLAKNISWSEPAFVKRARPGFRLVPWWFHFISGAIFALMVYIGLFVRNVPGDPWWSPYVAGVVFASVSYLLPVVISSTGAAVFVGPDGVTRMDNPLVMQAPILYLLGVGVTKVEWKRVQTCVLIENDELAGRPLRVLELYGEGEEPLLRVGLPAQKPTVEKLRDCLARNGRELEVLGAAGA